MYKRFNLEGNVGMDIGKVCSKWITSQYDDTNNCKVFTHKVSNINLHFEPLFLKKYYLGGSKFDNT